MATGTVFIQDNLGPVVIGASSAQTGFKNTFGGTTCFLTDVRVLASVIIDMDCQVKGTLITSSDSRIKDQVEDLDDNVCVNIIKAVKPKSYIKNNISNAQRECGFIAQDIQTQLTNECSNLVKEMLDDDFGSIYGIDYGRLTTLLWGVCRNLLTRVELLETALSNQ